MSIEQLASTERSNVIATVVAVASLMPAAVLTGLILDGSLMGLERTVAMALLFSLVVSTGLGVHRLATPRGGLWFDPHARRIGIGLSSTRDVWWLPVDELVGVEAERHAVSSDVSDFGWRASIVLRSSVRVVLLETLERDLAEAVAEDVATRTGLPLMAEEDGALVTRPSEQGEQRFAVNRGGALQALWASMGVTALLFGAGLYGQVDRAPVIGFMIAPVFVLMGAALSSIALFKRLGYEELRHAGGLWTHRYVLGSLSWGERTVSGPTPRWLIFAQPARGARLELHGEDGALVMANGATTLSRLGVSELLTLVDRFGRRA